MLSRKIDFAELRSRLSFANVLVHYRVQGKEKGKDQWQGYCPLPSHVHKGDGGKPRSPSFSVNTTRGIYNCFGCGGKGNVLEFVTRMEGFDPENGDELRKGALRAEEIFVGNVDKPQQELSTAKVLTPAPSEAPAEKEDALPVAVNAPLDFVLQGLDATHSYLGDRGFSVETIAMFGLGYCNRGLMKGRIAIPLHNTLGELIGYAGRIIDDALIDDDNPKYRFPGERVRDGTRHVFRKSAFLYNGCAIERPSLTQRNVDVVIVEGFPSVWWLTQHGITNVVATMGSSISDEQVEILVALLEDDARIWIVPDGDAAGERLATEALKRLAFHFFVRLMELPKGTQPTDLDEDQIDVIFASRERS